MVDSSKTKGLDILDKKENINYNKVIEELKRKYGVLGEAPKERVTVRIQGELEKMALEIKEATGDKVIHAISRQVVEFMVKEVLRDKLEYISEANRRVNALGKDCNSDKGWCLGTNVDTWLFKELTRIEEEHCLGKSGGVETFKIMLLLGYEVYLPVFHKALVESHMIRKGGTDEFKR